MKKSIFTRVGIILVILILWPNIGYSRIIKKNIPDKLVVFTFDDATASHYTVVAPLLKKYGFGATFYICEFQPNFKDTTKYMNWRQISELDKMGFEVANHSLTHKAVNKLTKEKFIAELKCIDKKCDSVRIPISKNFAYPGYSRDSSVVQTLVEQGYQFARIGSNRAYNPLTDHPLLIPSWCMGNKNKEQILATFDEAKNGKIVVLTIHGVPDIEHPGVSTSPALFEEHLKYLSENHFKVISIRELRKYINVKEAAKKIKPVIGK